MTEALLRLRELTENLPPVPDMPPFPAIKRIDGDRYEYEVDQGAAYAWSLLNIEAISCGDWFSPANTQFKLHSHRMREWLIVYEGEMILEAEDKEFVLKPGDAWRVEPECPHSARFEVDCRYLAICIPKCEDWPE